MSGAGTGAVSSDDKGSPKKLGAGSSKMGATNKSSARGKYF